MNPSELAANVGTIVVVMMENRSFDHVLGYLRCPDGGEGSNRTEVEGIEDLGNPAYQNANTDGVGISPFWMSDAHLPSDLPHDKGAVATQLAFASATGTCLMNGFVEAYEIEFHTSVDQPAVMGLLRARDLPTTSVLAATYSVCDHWFACLPTSTAPNRLMSLCGYTNIDDTKTFLPDQQTVYDWLMAQGVRWRVYSAGLPFVTLMPRLSPLLLSSHFRKLADLQKDVASEPASEWPEVIFIEPDYHDCPIHFSAPVPTPCDDHAPLAMAPGEAFLRYVYQTLTANAAKWARTVLVVTYDEHGGFFDHVAPPVLPYRNGTVSFDTAGVRTPTIVAGPFAPRGVCKTPLDNTSILQMLAERFGKPGVAYSSPVAARAGTFASLSTVLSSGADNTAVATLGTPGAAPMAAPAIAGSPDLRAIFNQGIVALIQKHGAELLQKYPELKGYGL